MADPAPPRKAPSGMTGSGPIAARRFILGVVTEPEVPELPEGADQPQGPGDPDVFLELAAEIADGERWEVIRANGWEDMQRRLAEIMDDLSVRRRQALMMLLFALVEQIVTPAQIRAWTVTHDLSDEAGVEELIAWLRAARAGGWPGRA